LAEKKRPIVVTGSSGFIGRSTCYALVRAGYEVHGIDHTQASFAGTVVPGVSYWTDDVVVGGSWMLDFFASLKPQAVIHLAGRSLVGSSFDAPVKTYETNVKGTISVLNAINRAGLSKTTRMVLASSSTVYGDASVIPTPEGTVLKPNSPYAYSKLHAEHWCRIFYDIYGLDCVYLRYFNVFGPYGRFYSSHASIVASWLSAIYDKGELFLYGDGTQKRDFVFVGDVARANIAAATKPGCFGGTAINIGSGKYISMNELKEKLEAITGRELKLSRKPARDGDVQRTLACTDKAKEMLQFSPKHDLDSCLKLTADWYEREFSGWNEQFNGGGI